MLVPNINGGVKLEFQGARPHDLPPGVILDVPQQALEIFLLQRIFSSIPIKGGGGVMAEKCSKQNTYDT